MIPFYIYYRCSVSSASVIWPGRPPATCRRAVFCSGAPPAAPRWPARVCVAPGQAQPPAGGVHPELPCLRSTFAYELAGDPARRHEEYRQQQNVFYYVTVRRTRTHPAGDAEGSKTASSGGMYLYRQGSRKKKRVQLLGSGTILREVIAAAALLSRTEVEHCSRCVEPSTSASCVVRQSISERWNMLHPMDKPRCLLSPGHRGQKGPVVAALTDYIRSFPGRSCRTSVTSPLSRWAPMVLADRTGVSQLRKFFEVNRHYVVVAASGAGRQRRGRRQPGRAGNQGPKIDRKPNPHLSE